MMKYLSFAVAIAALVVSAPSLAAETKGAGSTFVSPVMAKWTAAYKARTGISVSYQPVGSGIGVSLIKKAAVDFGASDMPLAPRELDKLGMAQFPLVIGGVVPVVHVEGIRPGEMRFTGRLLADIFPRQHQELESPGDPEDQSRTETSRHAHHRCSSHRRVRHDLQLVQLSFKGEFGVEGDGRRRHLGRVATRTGRQGQ
jgi:ABC-type phosphate transport system substrate-binding protein